MKNTTRLRWLGIAFGIFVSIAIAWWSYDRYLWPWWYVRGHWYFEERRAERLVREDPSKVENWGLLGCARYWTGDAVGSLDAYHHAWQLDTNNVDFTYAVAYAMLNAGHRDDAELWFSNIVTMSEQRGHPEWELNATNNLLFFQEERNRRNDAVNRGQPIRAELNQTSPAVGFPSLSFALIHVDDMEWILDFGVTMLATIPVTALFCRYRLGRKRRVSYGTMIAGVCIVTVAWLIFVSGGECFTPDFWSEASLNKRPEGSWWLRLLGFVAAICALPALGVVAYYQRRRKREETPMP